METSVVRYIGRIDMTLYSRCTCQRIITDEVVLTPNRLQHIIDRRGREFYDKYCSVFGLIVSEPDYIFKDGKANTALVSKMFVENGETVNIVLRLAVEGDNPEYKNSIISAVKEGESRFKQRLRNNEPIYVRDTLHTSESDKV